MTQTQIFGWCFGCGRAVLWPALYDGGTAHANCRGQHTVCGPVWPGVRARDQDEADRLIPEVLSIEAPGHIVEWVPGRGPIDLANEAGFTRGNDWNWLTGENYDWSDGTPGPRPARSPIRWLRIAADPGGQQPVDIAHVRAVVDQCWDAKVPVWIERLGKMLVNSSETDGPWPVYPEVAIELKDPVGADFREWPEDLRAWSCREVCDYQSDPDATSYAPGQPVPSRAR